MRLHGNWCGSGWTAGQYKDARDLTDADRSVPATDSLDEACKEHDIGLHDHPEMANEINQAFNEQASKQGLKGKIFGAAVSNFGPSPQAAMPSFRSELRKYLDDHEKKTNNEAKEWENLNEELGRWSNRKNMINEDVASKFDYNIQTPVQTPQNNAKRLRSASDTGGNDAPPAKYLNDEERTFQFTPDNTGDVNMEPAPAFNNGKPPAPGPLAAARSSASTGSTNNGIAKETPISSYPSLSYGLQETHTTILPWTGWLTAGGLDKRLPLQLKIRMNSPYDMLDATMGDEGTTDGALLSTKAFYRSPIDVDGRFSTSAGVKYPQQFGNNTSQATERPQWLEYWAQFYEKYTVLGCEYEIIMYNPLQAQAMRMLNIDNKTIGAVNYPALPIPMFLGSYNCDCVVAEQVDTFSQAQNSAGNIMPPTMYEEVRAFKNIKWHSIPGGKKAIIRGTYKPGDVKHNIINDGDVKTWADVGAAPTTYNEILTLNFWTDPMFNARQSDAYANGGNYNMSATGTAMKGYVNMEINLKYIVQFKDLKLHARYPNTFITNQDINVTLNEDRTQNGNPLMKWV